MSLSSIQSEMEIPRPPRIRARNHVAQHRERDAYALRGKGLTWQQIGDKLGISNVGARKAYYRALVHESKRFSALFESRTLAELERLSRMTELTYKAVLDHPGRQDYMQLYLMASSQLLACVGVRAEGFKYREVTAEHMKELLIDADNRGPIGAEAEQNIRDLESEALVGNKRARKRMPKSKKVATNLDAGENPDVTQLQDVDTKSQARQTQVGASPIEAIEHEQSGTSEQVASD